MTGHVGTLEPGYSRLTLALLEDTGWYEVNYEYATPMNYGQKAGCDFINAPCILKHSGKATNQVTCFKDLPDYCEYNGLQGGPCDLRTGLSNIPAPFQYFSDTTKGAQDHLMDACPVVRAYSNRNCRGIGKPIEIEAHIGNK
jgi:leishmanolysin